MGRSPSRSSDGGGPTRVEPLLIKAIEKERYVEVIAIIEEAKAKAQPTEHLLRIGLIRAVEREKVEITEYLLGSGANPDGAPGGRVSPVLKAIERNNPRLLQLLLRFGGNVDAQDKQGRTALMTAAWKNNFQIMEVLLKCGADVNKKDNNGRHVLHNLAADKDYSPLTDVIELLLRQNIALDGAQGQDESKRTPLHWAASTGKRDLCEMLLKRTRLPRSQVNAVEGRGKAPIHLAIAHGRDDIVETLLTQGADVMAKSDGSWTPLHNACEQGTVRVVRVLLGAGADVNARLLNGMTPLHIAAQAGHLEIVQCLLERKETKRTARDSFGITPFLRAAQNKRRDIVNLLAPSNNVETLSEYALGACNGFEATIVDFGHFHNENKVTRRTVYEVLYGKDAVNHRKPAVTILPKESKATDFRWIHLPANNMAWVEALLTKAFIEEGANDYEGFRALERSFTHQHRGQQVHSHFMRPLCQSTPRAPKHHDEPEVSDSADKGPPQIAVNGLGLSIDSIAGLQDSSLPQFSRQPVRTGTFSTDQTDSTTGLGTQTGKEGKGKQKDKAHKMQKWRGSKQAGRRSGGTETPTKYFDQHPKRKHSNPMTDSGHLRFSGTPGGKDTTSVARGNIFAFMPYLHFETNRRRKEMQDAIAETQKQKERNRRDVLVAPHATRRASTYDEMLLRAHLTSSQISLHVRRTLDQFFYHNINTESRDEDQVVYRYQCKASYGSPVDPKIFMVDQLWMWVLGKDLIVTAFPQRWQQPRNDPLNVLDGIIERLNSKTQEPVRNVYDLATVITERCSGVFDRHRVGDEDYQFLDMFESSIGDATELETMLFKEFNVASAQASAWLQHHRRANRFSQHLEAEGRHREHQNRRHVEHHSHAHALEVPPTKEEHFGYEDDPSLAHAPLFVDKLLDIGAETNLLAETKDIRDELNMIAKVLEDQRSVIPDLETAITDIYNEDGKAQKDVKKHFKDQLKTIDTHMKDLDRMDKQAERIYKSITDLLDLKQKHANAFEARFARDQAAGTARQSQTIMVFTIVTIVFLPLSFIAALFTINIEEFPHPNGSDEPILPMSYVLKFVFGIGLAISIPFIAIALSFDAIGDFFREVRRRWRQKGKHAQTLHGGHSTATVTDEKGFAYAVNTHALDYALSAGRTSTMQANGRRSIGSYLSHRDEHYNGTLRTATSRGTADKDGVQVVTHGNGMMTVNGRLSAEVRPSPIARRPTGFRIRSSTDIERG